MLFKVGKEVFFLFLLGFLNGGYFTGMLLPGALEFLKGFTQPVFLFFCGMMVLQLVWVKMMVPETKGVPLEEMEAKLGIH